VTGLGERRFSKTVMGLINHPRTHPMDYDWTNEQREVADRLAAICDDRAAQDAEALEGADAATLKAEILKVLGALAPTGYLTLGVGPQGAKEALALCAARQILARVSASLCFSLETSVRAFGGLLKGFGRPEAQEALWPQLSSGKLIGAVAVSEDEAPETSGAPITRASAVDSGYAVSGKKSYVTNGPIADWFAVSAAVDHRHAFFFIPANAPGLSFGPRIETLGYRGTAVCALELDNVVVPNGFTVGPTSDFPSLEHLKTVNNLILVAVSVGLMQRTVAAVKAFSAAQLRGGKPVARFQENRFKLAEMVTLTQTSELLAYRAAWMRESGDREADTLTLCAKVFASEASERVASLAMQTAAGKGFVAGNPIERAFRDSKFASLAGATSERARMAIADDILKRCKG
jgi:alkylation response protein AidB-like acyl-CoA dehydrogenase